MRNPMIRVAGLLVVALAALGNVPAAHAQESVRVAEGDTLTISGFVSGTVVWDYGLFGAFGQDQNAEYAAAPADQPKTTKSFMDGDIRNTRLTLTFTGEPLIGEWFPRAVVEADFFGGQDAPPFGDEQPRFRDRLAYADLSNGRTTLRIGQYWAPLFAEVPVSLSHIAFPLGYGASGMIGWRFPGVFLYQKFAGGGPVSSELQLAAMKGSGPPLGVLETTNGIGNGEASALPQLEARLNLSHKVPRLEWAGYVVGHLSWQDTVAFGGDRSNMTVWAVEGGAKLVPGPLTLHGNLYYGRGMGPNFGHITQEGDIRGWGAWAQAGFALTPRWDVWGFWGVDQPDNKRFQDDHPALAPLLRQRNVDTNAMLRFHTGRYAVGVEWFKAMTRWSTGRTVADQYSLSVMYTL